MLSRETIVKQLYCVYAQNTVPRNSPRDNCISKETKSLSRVLLIDAGTFSNFQAHSSSCSVEVGNLIPILLDALNAVVCTTPKVSLRRTESVGKINIVNVPQFEGK